MPAPGELSVRHLERMELGTPYPRVVERACEVMRHPKMVNQSRLVVDATGVGAPVVDLLRSAGLGVRLTAWAGGEMACSSGRFAGGVGGVAGGGELKICRRLKEAARLVRGLEAMRLTSGGGEYDGLAGSAGGEWFWDGAVAWDLVSLEPRETRRPIGNRPQVSNLPYFCSLS
jgi:hypothetical protein